MIKCKDTIFNVHRVVVCSQSEPLAAAIDGGFKEATTGVIDLEDDEPSIVEAFLQFLYKAEYEATINTTLPDIGELLFHTKVYVVKFRADVGAKIEANAHRLRTRIRSWL